MSGNFKILSKDRRELKSHVTLHPGEVLAMELEARGISKTVFASALGLKLTNLSGLLHQNRHLNAKLALKLEALLGIDAEFWMRVQSGFDLDEARKKFRSPSKLSVRRMGKPAKERSVRSKS
ncbi:MAG: HigA family addiction module antidote protein [Cyclobacteriaceae bacterium]|nr:HigA family addiction module antidote protein [Cytophagales bacterium]MBX2899143.1 HigA family addiction module antidote protein [Cyclobacteriaceae bacterium]